jgi:rSAM/selenodomain-associated transferase 2
LPVPLHATLIIPVLNEADTIRPFLHDLQQWRDAGHEIILVDGGSADETVALAQSLCHKLVECPAGRGRQMNAGAAVAGGEVLVFLHADTRLPADAPQHLQAFVDSEAAWGRFDVRLSGDRNLYRVIAWFMNQRSRLTGIATGDQAMFVRRAMFTEVGGFEMLPLMEDVALSRRLRKLSRPYCVSSRVITDSRRWEHHGAWRTIALMWWLRWRFWRGDDADTLAQLYHTQRKE